MNRSLIIACLLTLAFGKEFQCPRPDEDNCIVINKEDYRGQRPRCRGTGCPPCWTKRENGWECVAKDFGECLGRFSVDIEILDSECKRVKRLFEGDGGRDGKTLDLTFLDK
ncbi:hypothetical protein K502DRAFT_223438 [Neoconidiobolus thromboides FSU 785]|nr:hypothetical protein K502DRAFT_223438 [Neoconidiobolus thromboides FSU 785]